MYKITNQLVYKKSTNGPIVTDNEIIGYDRSVLLQQLFSWYLGKILQMDTIIIHKIKE